MAINPSCRLGMRVCASVICLHVHLNFPCFFFFFLWSKLDLPWRAWQHFSISSGICAFIRSVSDPISQQWRDDRKWEERETGNDVRQKALSKTALTLQFVEGCLQTSGPPRLSEILLFDSHSQSHLDHCSIARSFHRLTPAPCWDGLQSCMEPQCFLCFTSKRHS